MNRTMLLSAVIALALPGQALAADTGLRQIVNIGCHVSDNTCYVDISGNAVGPSNCSSISLRWSQSEANGKNILSLLTAAFLSGKQVRFDVSGDACYSGQPEFPTFRYINFR